MKKLKFKLLKHQYEFVKDVQTRNLALVGGYASGKTHALAYKAIYLAMINVGHLGLILSPIHAMNRNNVVPKFEEVLNDLGIPYSYRSTPYPKFILHFANGSTPIIFHAAENYRRIVGLNLAWFICDEVDTIEHEKMNVIWKVLISRLRAIGAPYKQACCVSTPEGYKFLYEYFEKEPKENPKLLETRRIIRASTYDNPYLDEEYINEMLRSYPSNLVDAYLHGKFVNLTSHLVYYNFDRNYNHTSLTLEEFDKQFLKDLPLSIQSSRYATRLKAPIHVGMDFNVGKCVAIVHVIKDDVAYAIDELTNVHDTQEMIELLKKKFPDRKIYVYPDASGDNESTNASKTDIKMLKDAGFIVKARKKNPRVKNRVNSMNAKFLNAEGKREYYINTNACPVYVEALETQAYGKDGKPDKMHDQDHPNDAAGYFIYYKWPIKKKHKKIKISGI